MTKERKQTLFALLAALGIVACLVALVFVSIKTHKYTLTFISEGATVAEEEVTTDTLFHSKFKPKKKDYVFVGWTLDTEENELFDFTSTPITSPNTFYAVYAPLVAAEKLFYDREVQEVEVGGTSQLYVLAEPIGFNNDILYTSADESIATVDEEGIVTAHQLGTTTIEAKSGDASTIITIVVKEAPATLTLTKALDLKVAEVVDLTPVITPDSAAHNYAWFSSNKNVVEVDEFGRLTGIEEGKAIITVSVGKMSAQCEVTVTRPAPTKIMFDSNKVVLNLASEEQSAYQIVYEVLPVGANQNVTFETANPVIATVDEKGYVVGKSVGETEIIVRTTNGIAAKIDVRVARTASAITKTQSTFGVWVGASFSLENYLSFNPASAKASYTLTWAVTSGAENISVDANTGKISGIKPCKNKVRVTATAVSVSDTQQIVFDIYVNGGEFTFDKPQGNTLYFVSGGGNSIDFSDRVSWTLYNYGVVTTEKLNNTDYSIKTSSNIKMKAGNLVYLASNPSSAQDVILVLTKTYQNHTYTTSEWTLHVEPELCVKKVDGRSTSAKPVTVSMRYDADELEITFSMQPYSVVGQGVTCSHVDGANYVFTLDNGISGDVVITTPGQQTMTLHIVKATEE